MSFFSHIYFLPQILRIITNQLYLWIFVPFVGEKQMPNGKICLYSRSFYRVKTRTLLKKNILFCHSCSMHSLLVPPFRTYFFSLKFFVMIFLIFFFKQLLCLSSPFFSSLSSKKKYVFIFGCAGSSLLCGPFSSCGR